MPLGIQRAGMVRLEPADEKVFVYKESTARLHNVMIDCSQIMTSLNKNGLCVRREDS